MGDTAQQLLTIAGVATGAALSYLAGGLNDRVRWRRERAAKLIEQRTAAYATYARAVKSCYTLAGRIAAARGLNAYTQPLAIDDGLPDLIAAAALREREWEHVLLLGDSATVDAARIWHRSVWRLEWYAHGWIEGADRQGWSKAAKAAGQAREQFYAAARRNLGIPGARLNDGGWPVSWMEEREPGGQVVLPERG